MGPSDIDATYSPTLIKDIMRRQDSIPSKQRIGTELVHLSSLIDFCPRQYMLAGDTVLPGDRPTGAHRVMWEMGLAAERHVVSNIVGDRQRIGVVARWTCPCEEYSYDGVFNGRARVCENCGKPALRYKQLAIENFAHFIIGTPDCAFYVGGLLLVIEVKSMNKDDFKALNGPLADHKFQGCGYRRLAQEAGYRVHPNVHLIYVQKEFKWGDPYKEYVVAGDDEATGALLDDAFAQADALKLARSNNVLPSRLSRCTNTQTVKARNCPLVGRCFASRD